ncbi:MAG: hypothetical protein WEB02_00190 [Methylophaga sp.]
MNLSKLLNQKGIGLVEVLVALLVVSLGLLALANFQGSLLKASGSNKARAEAIGIAQQELELIRYAATRSDDFLLVPTNPAAKTVLGTNALFTVTSVAEDPVANTIINVVVNVAWTDAAGDADNVTLMSEVGLQDIQKSAFATNDTAAAVAVPSPRQSASEDVRPASEQVGEDDVISPTETPLPATGTVEDGGSPSGLASSFNVTGNDGSIYNLEQIATDSRYYSAEFGDGVLAVYRCDAGGVDGGCIYIQNHFGGVSLSTSGTIYSANNTDNDLSGIRAVWSSSEVTACYIGPIAQTGSGNSAVYSMPYECVYAGNCSEDGDTCHPDVSPEQVTAQNVGPGGEFGNLGLIGLDGGNGGDQMCYLEDTPDWSNAQNVLNGNYNSGGGNFATNEAYLFPVTTRLYVTRQMMSNGLERSEGINRSYRNHNFLLVNRQNSPNAYKNCFNAVNASDETKLLYTLAPREIVRVNDSNVNTVVPTATFDGVMPAVTVISSLSGNRPRIYLPEVGSCYVKNNNLDYACAIPRNYIAPTFIGGSVSVPSPGIQSPSIPVNYVSCTTSYTVDAAGIPIIAEDDECTWSEDFN